MNTNNIRSLYVSINKLLPFGKVGMGLICALLLISSCKKEEVPVPDVKDTSYYFEPLPTDTTEEASIRRAFMEKYGSHLLFNDTIQHEFRGVNVLGDSIWFTEKLDINYYIGSSYGTGTLHYTYELLSSLEYKKKATEFVETYVLPHFTNELQPYSWLVVNRIMYHDALHKITYPYSCSGQRATAVACNGVQRYNESQKKKLAVQVIISLMTQIETNNSDLFDEFTSISVRNYGVKFAESTITNKDNTEELRKAGFFSKGKNEWSVSTNGLYPDKDKDVADYITLVATYTMEEIQTSYGAYEKIIEKASVMRRLFQSLGFKFDDDLAQ